MSIQQHLVRQACSTSTSIQIFCLHIILLIHCCATIKDKIRDRSMIEYFQYEIRLLVNANAIYRVHLTKNKNRIRFINEKMENIITNNYMHAHSTEL